MQLLLSDSGLCSGTGDGKGELSPHPASSSQGTNFANKPDKSFSHLLFKTLNPGVKEGGGEH